MTPEVELDGVIVERDGRRVLDGLSLRLEPGERIGLAGANGAGKTTLLRVIAGLQPISGGEVRLQGRACRGEAEFRRARASLGFLFQDSDDQLFCPTVIEDVAFGPLNLGQPRPAALAAARARLDDLGLGHLADRPVHRLSGGEKRLVCLAGILVMRPRVLLLDEPATALDGDAEERLHRELARFTGAILVVAHERAFFDRIGARVVMLAQGRLAPLPAG